MQSYYHRKPFTPQSDSNLPIAKADLTPPPLAKSGLGKRRKGQPLTIAKAVLKGLEQPEAEN